MSYRENLSHIPGLSLLCNLLLTCIVWGLHCVPWGSESDGDTRKDLSASQGRHMHKWIWYKIVVIWNCQYEERQFTIQRRGRGEKPVPDLLRDGLFFSVSVDSGVTQLGFQAWFYKSQIVWPWTRPSATLSLSFLICKMGAILMMIANPHELLENHLN